MRWPAPTSIFVNCPRYIHRYARVEDAQHAPRQDGSAPVAQWKRIDVFHHVLPEVDRKAVDAMGTVGLEEAMEKFNRGEG